MTAPEVPLGIYVHVPYCASRCGYCAFNTYVAAPGQQETFDSYVIAATAELSRAGAVCGDRLVHTVYFGGGTPNMLTASQLVELLDAVRSQFRCIDDLEVTTESNPDSVTPEALAQLRRGGFTRISFGFQSARPHVLAALERTHTPGATAAAAAAARAAGFDHISVDLIYGTPIETDDDWIASIDAALAMPIDHLSAYALTIEPSTRLAIRVKGARMAKPDDDAMAQRYELLDSRLAAAGFAWYELSNWARTPEARCRHNLGYWRGHDWWGIGPGAHSHLAGRRWASVANPEVWAEAVLAGAPIECGVEQLNPAERRTEAVMTRLRLAEGCPEAVVGAPEVIEALVADGLVERSASRLSLTDEGRLLADLVVRKIVTGFERTAVVRLA